MSSLQDAGNEHRLTADSYIDFALLRSDRRGLKDLAARVAGTEVRMDDGNGTDERGGEGEEGEEGEDTEDVGCVLHVDQWLR